MGQINWLIILPIRSKENSNSLVAGVMIFIGGILFCVSGFKKYSYDDDIGIFQNKCSLSIDYGPQSISSVFTGHLVIVVSSNLEKLKDNLRKKDKRITAWQFNGNIDQAAGVGSVLATGFLFYMIMNDRWSFIEFDQRENYKGLRSERKAKESFFSLFLLQGPINQCAYVVMRCQRPS